MNTILEEHPTNLIHDEEIQKRRRIIKSFTARANAHRTNGEKMADWLTKNFGSIGFLILNLIFFIFWVLFNLGFFKNVVAFDPYPFNLLTTFVSLEAIILAIFVLISQNRASRIDELREEIDLQIDILAEQEITKILRLQKMILEKNGIDLSHDKELEDMLHITNTSKIEKVLQKQMNGK